MKCPNCQTEIRERIKSRESCGSPLQPVCSCCQAHPHSETKYRDEYGQAISEIQSATTPSTSQSDIPTSFANGRYTFNKKPGEGGKNRVFVAYVTSLVRDGGFTLIKTEDLDDAARTPMTRKARALGRLNDNPYIVAAFNFGEKANQPYIVQPGITGGDIEDLTKKVPTSFRFPYLRKNHIP